MGSSCLQLLLVLSPDIWCLEITSQLLRLLLVIDSVDGCPPGGYRRQVAQPQYVLRRNIYA